MLFQWFSYFKFVSSVILGSFAKFGSSGVNVNLITEVFFHILDVDQ